METWGWVVLVVGAVVIGLLAQYAFRGRFGYEWIATAIGAGLGGYFASEYSLGGLGKWGTEWVSLSIFPALIGALVVAAVVEGVMFYALRAARGEPGSTR